ncbi:glycosyltransferase family 4 protein [Cytobacillus firmus]|uniref:glycosyltransferase family 4 protein n=1 Tax=Cytobacillus firmus TaxID=1399 RepID=UPI0024C15646|nr:glycosyltransferase family 4 protein [Cytobacillus firmus]WHY33856.1 glycosyltransferase family 4 protein [Cytobacillus firmus]
MKILYVTTVSDTMGFFIPHIKMLLEEGHSVDMACNIGKPIPRELLNMGCKAYNIEFQRSPFKAKNLKAYKKLKRLLQENDYDVVHTHTPVASVFTRFACKSIKKIKVIYTAHGFHFYKGAPIENWLIYFPVEKWLSRYTDVLITINNEDYTRATKLFNAGKVEYIPGVGIDTKKIVEVVNNEVAKRNELGIPKDAFIILSIGELNKNKNHETVIKTLAQLNNNKIYYLICGQGPLKSYLCNLIKRLGLEDQIKLLGFRQDIAEICMLSDLFVFPSYREGLSVALMEAMSCGLPVVCSNIRGNTDLIENKKGGYLVEPTDINGFAKSIGQIIQRNDLRKSFGFYNKETIEFYDMKNVLNQLRKIY